jgi:hypothetical protein
MAPNYKNSLVALLRSAFSRKKIKKKFQKNYPKKIKKYNLGGVVFEKGAHFFIFLN